jgi:hypothetical protein
MNIAVVEYIPKKTHDDRMSLYRRVPHLEKHSFFLIFKIAITICHHLTLKLKAFSVNKIENRFFFKKLYFDFFGALDAFELFVDFFIVLQFKFNINYNKKGCR